MIARPSTGRQSRYLGHCIATCCGKVASSRSPGFSDAASSHINRAVSIKLWRRGLAYEADRTPERLGHASKNPHSSVYSQQSQAVTQVRNASQTSNGSLTNEITQMSPAEVYKIRRRHAKVGEIGTRVGPFYEPQSLLTNPPKPEDVTLELLLASQSHLGHSTSLWNPMNSRYIYGIRQGIHIISLDVTASHLRRACRIVSGIAERGGLILFVGTRKGQSRCVVNAAKMAGGCHIFDEWMPGTLTNASEILGECSMKVVDEFDREIPGYQEDLVHVRPLKPDLVICLNPLENWVLLRECAIHVIPSIGIVDTDANPTWVTYPIPANDDSLRCVNLIAGVLGRAAQEGNKERLQMALRGEVLYEPTAPSQ